MKKLYLFLFALLPVFALQAQDMITKTDKSEIKANVLEITDELVKYKLYDFQEGPIYNIKRAEIIRIVYSNGREEVFNAPVQQGPASSTAAGITSALLRQQPAATTQPVQENPGRVFLGFTYTNHLVLSSDTYEYETSPVYGFNVVYEKYFTPSPKPGQESKAPSKGFGLASTNYFGYSETVGSEVYNGSRHYATAYLFKEFHIKDIVTLGGLAGGGMCYTRATADESNEVNPGVSAGVFGGGAHLGFFAQRHLSKNAEGKATSLLRFGYDMFFMSNYNGTLGINIALSF